MNEIIYIHDLIFYKYKDRFYTSSNLPEIYFDRFFDAGVGKVLIFSRLIEVDLKSRIPKGYDIISNKNLMVSDLCVHSYYLLVNPARLLRYIKCLQSTDFIVANIPSIIGIFTLLLNSFVSKKYSVEVAADYDQFSSKKGGSLVSFFMRPLMHFYIKNSNGAAYVSNYLRDKFKTSSPTIVASNVNINNIYQNKKYLSQRGRIKIAFIGGLNERKGLIHLFEAIQYILKNTNFSVEAHIIGGHSDRDWGKVVEDKALDDNVFFHGIINTKSVIDILDKVDLYIQPSLTEGIPRATLEAMSRGLPVIATKLPGFYEILDSEVLVNSGCTSELANKILEFFDNIESFSIYGRRNIKKVESFKYEILHAKRTQFYKKII